MTGDFRLNDCSQLGPVYITAFVPRLSVRMMLGLFDWMCIFMKRGLLVSKCNQYLLAQRNRARVLIGRRERMLISRSGGTFDDDDNGVFFVFRHC